MDLLGRIGLRSTRPVHGPVAVDRSPVAIDIHVVVVVEISGCDGSGGCGGSCCCLGCCCGGSKRWRRRGGRGRGATAVVATAVACGAGCQEERRGEHLLLVLASQLDELAFGVELLVDERVDLPLALEAV